jgi:type VI secretion system protein ImpK
VSTNEPQQPMQDPDRTILVPAPGGRRSAPVTSAGTAAPGGVDGTISPEARVVPRAPAFEGGAASTPASAAPLAAALHGHGLNRLVAAANPLLDLVLPLRYMAAYNQVENLRLQLIAAIKTFERSAKEALVPHDDIAAARYALCTFLDETISSTPWGGGGVWASRSLLVTFHNEASGGEKFFLVLQKLCQDPAAHIDTLELMYLCLALGLEGRYRVMENGRSQLDALRERLQQLIARQRGAAEPALSLHWQGASGKGEPLWRMLPVWVVGAIALSLLVLLHIGLSFSLSNASNPVYERLAQIQVQAPPLPAPAAPAAAPDRVARFLAPEVAQGLVSVKELPDRSIVTLNGNGVFAPGSADVAADFLPLLGRIGDALRPVPGKVRVVGHTDNTKGFSMRYPSNWDLSTGRATSVGKLLAERAGPVDRYTVEGRGDTEPEVPNDSAVNRARNRRVVIMVLAPPAS